MFQRRGVSKLSFAWAEGVSSAIRASWGGFFSRGSRIDQAKPGGIASMQGQLLTRSRARKASPHLASPPPGPRVLPRSWNEGAAAPGGWRPGFWRPPALSGAAAPAGGSVKPPLPLADRKGLPSSPTPELSKLERSQPGGAERPIARLLGSPYFQLSD